MVWSVIDYFSIFSAFLIHTPIFYGTKWRPNWCYISEKASRPSSNGISKNLYGILKKNSRRFAPFQKNSKIQKKKNQKLKNTKTKNLRGPGEAEANIDVATGRVVGTAKSHACADRNGAPRTTAKDATGA